MRKLKVLVFVFAMVLMTASPATAQTIEAPTIEFVDAGVVVVVEETIDPEESPITGAVALPELASTFAGGDAHSFAAPGYGAVSEVDETPLADASPEFGIVVAADDLCIDPTDEDLCA